MRLETAKHTKKEYEKIRGLALKRSVAESTRQRMESILRQLEEDIAKNEAAIAGN